MNDASWAISALLTVGCLLAAMFNSGLLAIGWILLAIGMGVVTYVRFNASRKPPTQ